MTVLLADTAGTGNGERLVQLAAYGIAYSGIHPTGAYIRVTLAARLATAQGALPRGIRLLVNKGHSSPQEQQRIIASSNSRIRASTSSHCGACRVGSWRRSKSLRIWRARPST